MLRTELYADPKRCFLHDLVLDSCRRNSNKTALVDGSNGRRLSYAEYGETVEAVARGLTAAGVKAGDVVSIFLANSWEFCTAFHGVQLAGAIPTLLNPTYREREVRYQLENSGATVLITDGGNIAGINLAGLPNLRRVYTTRQPATGTESFHDLLQTRTGRYCKAEQPSDKAIAALPYSSGTTGLPKGVMLSHLNLVANIYQLLGPNGARLSATDNILCCLPLYHIYGLNVILSPALILGATLIVTPRFNIEQMGKTLVDEGVTMMPLVP
ncbi:MAG: long-chain fatty acid--CoA ligase, partial [Acidobacteriota bacterium]